MLGACFACFAPALIALFLRFTLHLCVTSTLRALLERRAGVSRAASAVLWVLLCGRVHGLWETIAHLKEEEEGVEGGRKRRGGTGGPLARLDQDMREGSMIEPS
jgi:hypothetical protein